MEHKVPFHASCCRIQVHIIVRDLREHKLKQFPVPAFGFLLLLPLFLFSFHERSETVSGQDFAFSRSRVHKEPQDISPGPPVLFREIPFQVVLRGLSHAFHTVQNELGIC